MTDHNPNPNPDPILVVLSPPAQKTTQRALVVEGNIMGSKLCNANPVSFRHPGGNGSNARDGSDAAKTLGFFVYFSNLCQDLLGMVGRIP